jgi:catechol 2,3-dioxygenase-like lactoylglutathione lyase family enzyme
VRVIGIMASALVLSLAGCVEGPRVAGVSAAQTELSQTRLPVDFRRTTLVVRDMEASLAFYRDALGMQVQYDQELTSPRLQRRGSDGENRSRLVLLVANDSYVGMLGLWQFLDPTEHDTAPVPESGFVPGDIILVFNTAEQDEAFARAQEVEGARVIFPPSARSYPSEDGPIEVMVSMIADPDGHVVELNRVVSGLDMPT